MPDDRASSAVPESPRVAASRVPSGWVFPRSLDRAVPGGVARSGRACLRVCACGGVARRLCARKDAQADLETSAFCIHYVQSKIFPLQNGTVVSILDMLCHTGPLK